MIIPSHSFGVVAASRPRVVAAVANDVTPDAITPAWNLAYFGDSATSGIHDYSYATRQITGINQQITLSITNDYGSLSNSVLYYKVDTTSPSYSNITSPVDYGFTVFNESASFSASNGNYVTFCGRWTAGFFGEEYGTITIRNSSDNNAILGIANFDMFNQFA